jgi:hypothetical protein
MSDYRRSEVISGLFVTLAVLVFALFAFKVGRFDLLGLLKPEAISARAFLLDVRTVQVGSKVKVGGREVGEITAVQLVEGPWPPDGSGGDETLHRLINEVTFELTDADLRLDLGTARVSVAQDSLLSPHFLKLDPGRWPRGQPPPPIFAAELPDQILIASVETGGIDEIMAVAGPAVDDLAAILRTVNRELLTPDNVATVRRVLDRLEKTLQEGQQIAASLNHGVLAAENVQALDRIIHNLDRAVADGQAVAARVDELLDADREPSVDDVFNDVAAVSRELRDNLGLVSSDLRHLLGTADEVLVETRTELVETSRRLRRALWQGELALRKIRANPALLLFGDDETDFEAPDFDMTEIRLRGRARPYGQRDEKDDE